MGPVSHDGRGTISNVTGDRVEERNALDVEKIGAEGNVDVVL